MSNIREHVKRREGKNKFDPNFRLFYVDKTLLLVLLEVIRKLLYIYLLMFREQMLSLQEKSICLQKKTNRLYYVYPN